MNTRVVRKLNRTEPCMKRSTDRMPIVSAVTNTLAVKNENLDANRPARYTRIGVAAMAVAQQAVAHMAEIKLATIRVCVVIF